MQLENVDVFHYSTNTLPTIMNANDNKLYINIILNVCSQQIIICLCYNHYLVSLLEMEHSKQVVTFYINT